MRPRVLLLVLLVTLLVPHTSASTCFSGPESIFVRLKILIFGEFYCSSVHISSSFTFNQPDLGSFLLDVGSDIYNGITFINDSNPIWGATVLGVIFIPMTLLYVGIALYHYRNEDSSQSKKLLILLFA